MMIKKEACPACRSNGHDNSGDNLARYPDGHAFCFACGYREGNGTPSESGFPHLTFECVLLLDKGITVETCEAWGVRTVAKRKRNGMIYDTGVVAFPYPKGVKLRNRRAEIEERLPKKQTIRYHGEPDVFGTHVLTGSDCLVITEGETDAMYFWQCLDGAMDVLAVPGAKLAKLLDYHQETLEMYNRITVFGDNDDAGREFVEAVRKHLPLLSGYVGVYPHKDACECTADELTEALDKAEPLPDDLLTGTKLKDSYREAKRAKPKGFIKTGIDTLDEILAGGFRVGDVVGLLGNTGVGKSTLAAFIAYQAMLQNHRVLYVATEMKSDDVLDVFRMFADVDEYEDEFFDYVSERLVMIDDTTDYDTIEAVVIAAVKKRGVRLVVIDVLQDIEDFDEWRYAKKVMARIEELALGDVRRKQPGVPILLVTHTKYVEGRMRKQLDRSSVAGGSGVSQKMTTIIGIEGDEYADEEDEAPSSSRRLRLIKRNRFRRAARFVATIKFTGNGYTQVEKQARGERDERTDEPPRRRRSLRTR
jgi:twinkle protein